MQKKSGILQVTKHPFSGTLQNKFKVQLVEDMQTSMGKYCLNDIFKESFLLYDFK